VPHAGFQESPKDLTGMEMPLLDRAVFERLLSVIMPVSFTHRRNFMNQNPTIAVTEPPLHLLLRRRRQELRLLQADVAAALHVSPECITMWESGRRPMELSKLPRLAAALQIDAKELCTKALAEFHPLFFRTLFASDAVAQANT
jgi:DNA-binding XRE family transcriptional regulator